MESPEPTLDLATAAAAAWDVIVIGAGPAGAVAARQIAMHGCRTLLVDKAVFPRRKVCGGCLNASALRLLDSVGLGDLPDRLGGEPTSRLLLATGGRQASIGLPGGVAVSRQALDAALVRAALGAGAKWVCGSIARIIAEPADLPRVRVGGHELRARVVVAADGLAGTSLRDCSWVRTRVARRSRIGAGCSLEGVSGRMYPPGVIHMTCGRGGYVGLTRVEAGVLNVAAAFDPAFVQTRGGLALAARDILTEAGLTDPPGMVEAGWTGTSMLSVRRRPVARERVFLIGDTAEYVEPFTGEGMGWAIASAIAVAPLAARAADAWHPRIGREWVELHDRLIHARSMRCRLLAWLLRRPRITQAGVALLARMPLLARPIVDGVTSGLGSRVSIGGQAADQR